MNRRRVTLLLSLILTTSLANAATLTQIRQTKILRCGIDQETPEYSTTDDHGPRQAFDADICRAVSIAILGPGARTTLIPYPDDVAAMAALRAGKVDLLPTLTLDLTHSSNPSLTFSPPLLYDGVGFLVPLAPENSPALIHASQLSGKKVCFLAETQVEVSLRTWFQQQHLDFVPFPFQEEGEMEAAFVTGNCAALAGDLTRLASTRAAFGSRATRYALLPDQISQDPLAAGSPSTDPAFAAVVQWTIEALLNAESTNLTRTTATQLLSSHGPSDSSSRSEAEGSASQSTNPPSVATAESASPTPDPTLEILTGRTREIGSRLGLSNAWATQVLSAVGNYGEIFDRDLGSHSPLKLPRAENRLYTQGGLMYPLPLK